jgi:hypothetical protein
MSIISLTITESATQTLPGIPDTIAVSANEPCIIFYTLDGTDPTTFSPIYIVPIVMPQNLLSLTLKIYATNQMDSSAIITRSYNTTASSLPTFAGDRLPHSAITNLNNNSTGNSLFPFGTSSPEQNFNYLNPANAGTTMYDQSKPAISSGFDADGNPAGFTNNPINEFKQVYSTTNQIGAITPGVGNLPAKITIIGKSTPEEYNQERSSFGDKIFNPRALVVFQDATNEDPTNPVHINRPYFSLENQEIVRDGNLLFNSTLDSPTTMGSFVNRHYNARTNMMTHSYYDNTNCRWIFSSFPYQPTTKDVGALGQMVFSREKQNGTGGAGVVLKWIPFKYRTLI